MNYLNSDEKRRNARTRGFLETREARTSGEDVRAGSRENQSEPNHEEVGGVEARDAGKKKN